MTGDAEPNVQGWHPYPGAQTPRAGADFPPVEPGRVVGIGAVCDLRPLRADVAPDRDFRVSEFVRLEDGRRVTVHDARGFSVGVRSTGQPGRRLELRGRETLESLTRAVLNVVRPDDDACAEDHPWSWLADLARGRGLAVTADDLRSLPYEVVFTDEVHRWLSGD